MFGKLKSHVNAKKVYMYCRQEYLTGKGFYELKTETQFCVSVSIKLIVN